MGIKLEDISNPLVRKQVLLQLKNSDLSSKTGFNKDTDSNKYKNTKDTRKLGEIVYEFDSKKEAKYFDELYLKLKQGLISNLKVQPKFDLIPTLKWNDKTLKKIIYKADFEYLDLNTNKTVVVDAKGFQTDVYKLKKRLLSHLQIQSPPSS